MSKCKAADVMGGSVSETKALMSCKSLQGQAGDVFWT